LILVAALGFGSVLVALTADLSLASGAKARAQAAADAAALAAAQELAVPGGREPVDVAAEYADRNGATLVGCSCAGGTGEAVATVRLEVDLPFLGQTQDVEAVARAVVAGPAGSEGLQPFFAARLACLFDLVPGLWIVSGFRTRAEQAALYRLKPELAAPPGHSNHELGLAADLGFPSGSAQRVAHRTASSCDLTFPVDGEPWHVEPS
jgi:hypothetical protein